MFLTYKTITINLHGKELKIIKGSRGLKKGSLICSQWMWFTQQISNNWDTQKTNDMSNLVKTGGTGGYRLDTSNIMTKVYQLLCLYLIFQQTCIHTNTLITCHVCSKSVTKRKNLTVGNLIATSTNPNSIVPQHHLCTKLCLCTALHLLR